ncbi:MAG: SAM-dependent methyltransferase [Actinomycetota bacterium]
MTTERFDQYMNRCLYHPQFGFYASGTGRAGRRRGDFITSPEVGPLFATVLSRALDTWWQELGCPEPFPVFDAGTGPSTFVRQLDGIDGPSKAARRVRGFDRPGGDDLVPAADVGSLGGAVVIANELLDNLAVRIVERLDSDQSGAAHWGEVTVSSEGGVPVEAVVPIDGLPAPLSTIDLPADLPVGTRVAVHADAAAWVGSMLDAGVSKLVAFDYGAETTAELAARGGWLRTYRQHQRGADPYREPGEWDITVDVGFDQLPSPTRIDTQASFLRRHGIDELVDEGARYWREHAARPDLTAIAMRSRTSEADALCAPDGLGGWLVAEWDRTEV